MTTSPIHVVLHPQPAPGVAAFLRSLPGIELHQPADEAGVVRALDAGAQVLATYIWKDSFLRPSLRWIAGMGAGIEQYPLAELAARDVALTTAAGVHAGCVAEHAFALMLALTRRVGEAVRHMGRHHWQALPGEELGGKKLAIVGLGRIGEEIARRAGNWDMQLTGVKRDPGSYRGCVGHVRAASELPQVCEWADILLLCAPATPDKRWIVGEDELTRLGAGWIVNVGRGSLIDEPALVRALTAGRLRGAALDVTAVEPLPAESPLWDLPNVVVTAHNAGDSPGYGPRWGVLFRQNLAAFHGAGEWVNRVEATSEATP